jgi:putative nucleotidyltransferase with HDIG domain
MTEPAAPPPSSRIVADADRAFGRALGSASSGAALLAALQREDLDAAGMARLIGAAPVLAATVMRVANSAFYGLRGRIGSLPRAVATLGTEAIRGIVLAASLRHLGRQLDTPVLDGGEWLAHSVSTALAARRLALAHAEPQDAETAFVAGLLHDLGWAVFAATQPLATRACLDDLAAAPDRGAPRCAGIERQHFGVTHAECGALVAAHWGLPEPIVLAIREHHGRDAASAAVSLLGAIVRSADAAAIVLVRPLGCEAGWDRPAPSAAEMETLADIATATAELLETLAAR